MSYTKNTWQTGDTITAEKLNNMENGIENFDTKNLIIKASTTDLSTLTSIDKTYTEIIDCIDNGGLPTLELLMNSPNAPYDTIYYLRFTARQPEVGDDHSLPYVSFCLSKGTFQITITIKSDNTNVVYNSF